ncbi:HAMP domain-containing sensor histidine kinase [Amycolatopsis carbonis]|uniref:histidine kinase n=1 Tax=Amycolatopsis carbonis TaxID=715471 RepID=A0A9Y2ICI9_9PSEU|nr:HAMP domain-containing sensor histidine kinase [Amycolatopsis sp. 2-15]WIX76756.1 HAMP domain-containing sensor histidine kinase [Amycolatopsis sp. 2-15]
MRRRIVLTTVLAALVAIGLFGVPLAVAVARYFVTAERAELERAADSYALDVSADILRHRAPDRTPATEDPTFVAVYSPAGRLLAGAGPPTLADAGEATAADEVLSADTPGELVVVVPISDDGSVVALVRAATARTEVYWHTGLTWLGMAGLAVVALLSAYLVARRQARRLARPLEQLSATARDLGDGDFSIRADRAGIPEIDSVGESLDSTAVRLDDLLARERAFSADASHQLRTPLAGLRLQLEAALENPHANLRDVVEAGVATTGRLDRTVTDLLALARDTPPVRDDVTDLACELAGIETEWAAALAEHARDLVLKVEPVVAGALLSGPVLRQIMTVLLDNALRHGAGTVTVTARDAGDVLAVDVADEGEVNGTDVFDRRSPGARGTGIGLALARRLAEAEGGRLRLTRPRPALFTLLLPLEQ